MTQTAIEPITERCPAAAGQTLPQVLAFNGVASERISQPRLIGALVAADVLAITFVGYWTGTLSDGLSEMRALDWSWMPPVVALAAVALFRGLWLYSIQGLRSFVRQAGRMAGGLLAVFIGMMAGMFLLELGGPPRSWLINWLVLAFVMLACVHFAAAVAIHHWTRSGRLVRRGIVIGGGPAVAQVLDQLSAARSPGIRILGFFDDRGDHRSPPVLAGHVKLGDMDDVGGFCRRHDVDLIIVALPPAAEARLMTLLKTLWELPVDVRLAVNQYGLRLAPRAYSYIGDMPFLALFDKPLSDWDRLVKAIEDRVLGSVLLLAALPVMALVALAVRLDSKGPVLFRQKRYGFNNELIEVFKFRSMHVEASDADACRLVTRGDSRITRVGRFIRRTSLDELPQLLNVVRGELSIVGPRPHALMAKSEDRLYQDVVDGYFARHKLKPGITGWAQINGWRGETDTREKIERRVECDMHYIDNWSVWFDLYIMALTPIALITGRNAY